MNGESFTQLAWSDMRTTSGSWRVAKDFANLPAWIVKAVGGSTTHWAGASLRFDEHEFKAKSTYGSMPGANLLDWPITLAEMEPWYAKAEDKMGVTRTNEFPACPATTISRCWKRVRRNSGYKTVHTGNMAINSEPAMGAHPASRLVSASKAANRARNGRLSTPEIPKGECDRKSRSAPNSMVIKIEHDASGKVTGVVYADETGAMQRQKARVVAVAGQLDREPAPAAQQRLEYVPGRSCQLVRPDRPQLHAAHDGQRVCRIRKIGAHCTAAPPWPASSVMRLARPQTRICRWL